MPVMGRAKSPGLGHVHLLMGVKHVRDVVIHVTAVMHVSLGTAVMGGPPAESRGRAATLVTTITGTAHQRAETRTSEVTRGILHISEY